MRVFVTGAEGYIGVMLPPILVAIGHHVVGLDTSYYRHRWLSSDSKKMQTFATARAV